MDANKKEIHIIQVDTIFKALHYVCRNEGIEVNAELNEVFTVLSEDNPNDTNASDCIDVMESLKDFIKNHETYEEYFKIEGNEEDEKS